MSIQNVILILISFALVAFGQPAWVWWAGLMASAFGYALFWRVLFEIPQPRRRFYLSMAWYAGVQIVQLSWMVSHPFLYIYGVVLFCAIAIGAQFGIISLFIQPKLLKKSFTILIVASLWTIFEWSRLYFLSGLSFNPVGVSLAGSTISLPFAAVGGVFFLSFWVILTNLVVLRSWMLGFAFSRALASLVLVVLPYAFGLVFFQYHESKGPSESLAVLLVQPASPVDEADSLSSPHEKRDFFLGKWAHLLSMISEHRDKSIQMIVFPEYVIPYGPYYPVYPSAHVKALFAAGFGEDSLSKLPSLESPYAASIETERGKQWFVTNSFFAQALSNLFQSDVVIGLEDHLWEEDQKKMESYSAALHYSPMGGIPVRYSKQVLVPMGEYIPFAFCRDLAARYGVFGSFTPGSSSQVCQGKVPFSPSICYEETYSGLMREGRVRGAELFVNLTSDAWFPNSRLPRQHLEHSRLRTVENGVPLIRACNTGVTCVIDSLGRDAAVLGLDDASRQNEAGVLYAKVPLYHYETLYSKVGDALIIGLSSFIVFVGLVQFIYRRKMD